MLVSKRQEVCVRKAAGHHYCVFVDVRTSNKHKDNKGVVRGEIKNNHTLPLTRKAKNDLIRQLQQMTDVEPED